MLESAMKWSEPEKKDSLAGLKVDDVPTGMNGVVAVFGLRRFIRRSNYIELWSSRIQFASIQNERTNQKRRSECAEAQVSSIPWHQLGR